MMNYNLPPDEGKKKKELYWNVCIVLGIIAIIAFIIAENNDPVEARGEYVTNSAGDRMYECMDGERLFDPEESLEKNGIEDCIDGSDEVKWRFRSCRCLWGIDVLLFANFCNKRPKYQE